MHPEPAATGSAPAPADPLQSLAAQLDGVMAEAEIAANAQRDVEAEEAGNPTAPSPRQEAQTPEAVVPEDADEPAAPVPAPEAPDEDEEETESPEEEDDDADEEPAAAAPPEQPKYSRRDAARFAQELEQAKQELEQTRTQLETHRGELGHVKASDQRIRAHLQTQSGYVTESNGRFRYENLSEKVLNGQATQEEADEVATMRQWAEFAGPIFRAAEEQVLGSFASDWAGLKELEGIGDDGLKKLNATPRVPDAMRELHGLAFAAGEAKAKKATEATIARLRAENKSLKTTAVARSPQPASSNGAAVPGKGSILARMIDPTTGLPNPEFDREVAAGKWLGADLSQA